MISMVILEKLMKAMKISVRISDLVELFLKQSSRSLSSMPNIILVSIPMGVELIWIKLSILIIWICMITILSYSFSSVLLLTYFKSHPVKVANSIEDVISNQELNVAGYSSGSKLNTILDSAEHQNLLDRIAKYEKKMNITGKSENMNQNFMDKFILRDVMKGKAIILTSSHVRRFMIEEYIDFKLEIGENSYNPFYTAFRVSKNFTLTENITKA